MTWRETMAGLLTISLLLGLLAAPACSSNPPPAGPSNSAGVSSSKAPRASAGGLYFDPEGADFTLWINRFKDEAYRNWVVPQDAVAGTLRGHVDFEFTVERDGSMSAVRLLKSSGADSLDRPAHTALTSSRLLPLPDDYQPPRITMRVSFYYNEPPR